MGRCSKVLSSEWKVINVYLMTGKVLLCLLRGFCGESFCDGLKIDGKVIGVLRAFGDGEKVLTRWVESFWVENSRFEIGKFPIELSSLTFNFHNFFFPIKSFPPSISSKAHKNLQLCLFLNQASNKREKKLTNKKIAPKHDKTFETFFLLFLLYISTKYRETILFLFCPFF